MSFSYPDHTEVAAPPGGTKRTYAPPEGFAMSSPTSDWRAGHETELGSESDARAGQPGIDERCILPSHALILE